MEGILRYDLVLPDHFPTEETDNPENLNCLLSLIRQWENRNEDSGFSLLYHCHIKVSHTLFIFSHSIEGSQKKSNVAVEVKHLYMLVYKGVNPKASYTLQWALYPLEFTFWGFFQWCCHCPNGVALPEMSSEPVICFGIAFILSSLVLGCWIWF